jgi:hypothetical protein
MWYDQERNTWTIKIKNKFQWKSSDDPGISVKCRYEVAKKVYREMLKSRPELKITIGTGRYYSLEQEYYEIMELAGVPYRKRKKTNIEEDVKSLSPEELEYYLNYK